MPTPTSEPDRNSLELEKLRKEIEKLKLDIEAMHASTGLDRLIGRYLPLVTAMLAVAGFWFGVLQYNWQRQVSETERKESLLREAARPFWENQLKYYIMASQAASTVANSDDPKVVKSSETEFWILYWGPLACFEDIGISGSSDGKPKAKAAVEGAMVAFGKALKNEPRDKTLLQRSALNLSHAIRDEIGPSFHLTTPESANQRTP